MLENLMEYHWKSELDLSNRKHSPRLRLTKQDCKTNKNASDVLRNSKKKKEVENDLLSCLVPLTFKSYNRSENPVMSKQLRPQHSYNYILRYVAF